MSQALRRPAGRRHLRRGGHRLPHRPSSTTPTWQALHDAWLEYALLIFPGQFLTRDEQIAFAKRFGPLEFEMARDQQRPRGRHLAASRRRRRRRQDPQGQRGLARRFDLHADPGQGRGVQRRGRADDRRPHRLGRHARRLRRARRRRPRPRSRASPPTIRCTTARAARPRRRRRATDEYRGYGFERRGCRCGRWSRSIPRPAASRC